MITDLIELTRVRLGAGISIKPTQTCMREICMNAVDEMKAIHPKRTFRLDCHNELPGEWDRVRMCQVLSNLVGNAIQHGEAKSSVAIAAKNNGYEVELSVHNEGPAIPPKMIPRLFDCLFQGSSDERAADSPSTSLGLGLYIAKEIISAHGGTISVQSSEREGTTFTVRLPRVSFKGGAGNAGVRALPSDRSEVSDTE